MFPARFLARAYAALTCGVGPPATARIKRRDPRRLCAAHGRSRRFKGADARAALFRLVSPRFPSAGLMGSGRRFPLGIPRPSHNARAYPINRSGFRCAASLRPPKHAPRALWRQYTPRSPRSLSPYRRLPPRDGRLPVRPQVARGLRARLACAIQWSPLRLARARGLEMSAPRRLHRSSGAATLRAAPVGADLSCTRNLRNAQRAARRALTITHRGASHYGATLARRHLRMARRIN